jgi:AraC family transcriptional regulator
MPTEFHPPIEVYEHGRRVPSARQLPAFSSAFLGEGVIIERHLTPQSARYGEREQTNHTLYLYEGEPVRAAWKADGKQFDGWLRSGRLWIVPHSMPHTSSFAGPHGGIILSIANSQIERHIGPFLGGRPFKLTPEFNLEDGQLQHLLRALLAVAQEGSCEDALVGELLVNAVCVRLAKRFAIPRMNSVPCRGGLPPARLKRVVEYIESNLDKNITLTQLARVANMSLYYFAVLFRQSTNLSPHRYILGKRVERAKELLHDPKLSVLDVSMNVGFEHQNNFARAFRRVIGVSPTEFKRGCV